MTKEQTPNRIEIKPSQVLAGALAAVTAALLGSRLGSVGTLTGAAVGSAVTTTASTVYLGSLERAKTAVASTRLRLPTGAHRTATGTDGGTDGDPPTAKDAAPRSRSHLAVWGLAAAGALAAFALALLVITGLEGIRGTRLSGGSGTTLGQVVEHRAPTSSTPPAGTPTPSTSAPSPTPSGTPTGSATPTPTGSATGTPSISIPPLPGLPSPTN
jgi:hypothetical protein